MQNNIYIYLWFIHHQAFTKNLVIFKNRGCRDVFFFVINLIFHIYYFKQQTPNTVNSKKKIEYI